MFEKGRHGRSLLYEAIEENDDATAVFLLNNGGIDEESYVFAPHFHKRLTSKSLNLILPSIVQHRDVRSSVFS